MKYHNIKWDNDEGQVVCTSPIWYNDEALAREAVQRLNERDGYDNSTRFQWRVLPMEQN